MKEPGMLFVLLSSLVVVISVYSEDRVARAFGAGTAVLVFALGLWMLVRA